MKKCAVVSCILGSVLFSVLSYAEENPWEFSLETTLWGVGAKTDVSSGSGGNGLSTEGQTGLNENDKGGAMAGLKARKDRFLIIGNILSAGLKDALETESNGPVRNTEDCLTFAEAFLGYRLLDLSLFEEQKVMLDFLIGGRYYWNRFVIDEVAGGEARDSNDHWGDLTVGGEMTVGFDKKWSLFGHGDAGGFGLGGNSSQQAFRVASGVEHHFNERLGFRVGYQMTNIEKRGSDNFGDTSIDLFFHGPTVTGIFNF